MNENFLKRDLRIFILIDIFFDSFDAYSFENYGYGVKRKGILSSLRWGILRFKVVLKFVLE